MKRPGPHPCQGEIKQPCTQSINDPPSRIFSKLLRLWLFKPRGVCSGLEQRFGNCRRESEFRARESEGRAGDRVGRGGIESAEAVMECPQAGIRCDYDDAAVSMPATDYLTCSRGKRVPYHF